LSAAFSKAAPVTAPPAMLTPVAGGVTAPRGFQAAGVHAGIKRKRRDVALIVSAVPAAAAATYTTNIVKAAPLLVTREHIAQGPIRAIVCNSGNANAVTGEQGLKDARRMAAVAAEAIGARPEQVAVASTGVIGVPLPMDKIEAGIRRAAAALGVGDGDASDDGGSDSGSLAAARAIMTTDTVPKQIAVEFSLRGKTVRIGAIAKGSGMIHPNMATMLAFVTTDAAVSPAALQAVVSRSVDRTYNRITVDGDTSTNDMVVVLANGLAGNEPLGAGDPELDVFAQALDYVNTYLAKAIARDGEGATKLIEVRVEGAASEADALQVARAIAGSNLVKTAVYGNDPNWGRILAAAGRSGVDFDPSGVDIWVGDVLVARHGAGVPFDEARAAAALQGPEVVLTVALQAGTASAVVWTCDLTEDYVRINARYRT